MGCFSSKTTKESLPQSKSDILLGESKLNEAKPCQGVKELRANYNISSKTQVIGTGAFGKVFKTFRKKDPNSFVAIKVLDKIQLRHSLD